MRKVLFIALMAISMQSHGNPAFLTNNTKIIFDGDSFFCPGAGQRFTVTVGSYYINYHPTNFVSWRDFSGSGSGNTAFNQVRYPRYVIPSISSCYGVTNSIHWTLTSGNGGLSSNSMRSAILEVAQMPTNSYTTNTSLGLVHDWPYTHPELYNENVVSGDPPYYATTGGNTFTYGDGGKTASAQSPNMYFTDIFRVSSNSVVTYNGGYPANSNLFILGQNPYDHVGNWIEGAWALTALTYPTNNVQGLGADTNAFTFVLDALAAAVSSSSHCTVSNLSGNTSSISFRLLCDRMAPGMWHPGIGPTTNDMTGCTNLIPSLMDSFCEICRVTNLVSGTYRVTWDATNSYNRTSAQLAAGDNLFFNFSFPLAYQRANVLYDMCVMMDCSPTNQSDLLHPGDNRLIIRYKSAADAVWPTNAPSVSTYTSIMAPRETELEVEDIIINGHAQQVWHDVTIQLLSNTSDRAPFR